MWRIPTVLAIRRVAKEKQRNRIIIQCDNSVTERDSRLDENTETGIFSLVRLPMESFMQPNSWLPSAEGELATHLGRTLSGH